MTAEEISWFCNEKKIREDRESKPNQTEVPQGIFVVQAKSAGYEGGNFAQITINDKPVVVQLNEYNNQRGLHVVVINPKDGEVDFAKVFDTYKSGDSFDKFIDEGVKEGFIIVAACKDDCVTNLSNEACEWFYY